MRDFRDLRVWDRSHQLTLQIYAATTNFPKHELYGLTSQKPDVVHRLEPTLLKAAVSKETTNSRGTCRSRLGRRANWTTIGCYRVICGSCPRRNIEPSQKQLVEVRKMLSALLQKIETDRFTAKC
jgi:hypothetical protein